MLLCFVHVQERAGGREGGTNLFVTLINTHVVQNALPLTWVDAS